MSKAERKLNVSTVLTVLHDAMAQLVFTIFFDLFQNSRSGFGSNHIRCITHATKKALTQTTEGLMAISDFLINMAGFYCMPLGQLQSHRIEVEFSVYLLRKGC